MHFGGFEQRGTLFFGEGSLLKWTTEKKSWYPYSNLSTRPRQCWPQFFIQRVLLLGFSGESSQ